MTWINGKGGIKKWDGPRPEDATEVTLPEPVTVPDSIPTYGAHSGACVDCGKGVEKRTLRCWKCHRDDLTRNLVPHSRMRPRGQDEGTIASVMARLQRQFDARPLLLDVVTCEDCGCLNRPAERCPNCLLWAELDAARMTWKSVPFAGALDADSDWDSGRIRAITTTVPAARQCCYPGPDHREGVAS